MKEEERDWDSGNWECHISVNLYNNATGDRFSIHDTIKVLLVSFVQLDEFLTRVRKAVINK